MRFAQMVQLLVILVLAVFLVTCGGSGSSCPPCSTEADADTGGDDGGNGDDGGGDDGGDDGGNGDNGGGASTTLVLAETEQTTYSGTIVDEEGNPLEGVTVTIGNPTEDITDALGNFSILGPDSGFVEITVDPTTMPDPQDLPIMKFQGGFIIRDRIHPNRF